MYFDDNITDYQVFTSKALADIVAHSVIQSKHGRSSLW